MGGVDAPPKPWLDLRRYVEARLKEARYEAELAREFLKMGLYRNAAGKAFQAWKAVVAAQWIDLGHPSRGVPRRRPLYPSTALGPLPGNSRPPHGPQRHYFADSCLEMSRRTWYILDKSL